MTHLDQITTPLKSRLLQKGWGDAIMLLDDMLRVEPEKTQKWFNNGSTLDLRDAAERFRNFTRYKESDQAHAFINDVWALDAAYLHVGESK